MPRPRSKTLATWLALTTGGLGGHLFYLHGWKHWSGWLHPLPTLLGVWGVLRILSNGQDDALAPMLIPLGGLSLSAAMLTGIVLGLTPDDKWQARFGVRAASGWAVVIGVVLCLLVGAGVLMSTITYGVQRYFELHAGP